MYSGRSFPAARRGADPDFYHAEYLELEEENKGGKNSRDEQMPRPYVTGIQDDATNDDSVGLVSGSGLGTGEEGGRGMFVGREGAGILKTVRIEQTESQGRAL